MDQDPRETPPSNPEAGTDRDASEVVDGPVGDAQLLDPTDAERLGADLEALPAIDDQEPPDDMARDTKPDV